MTPQPFKRARAFMAAIQVISAMALPHDELQKKYAELGSYRTKGKCKSSGNKARHGKHMDTVRASIKARNKPR